MTQCCKRVYGHGSTFHGSPCSVPAKVEIDGRWYCHIHSPEGVEKRKAAVRKRYSDKNRAWQAQNRRAAARADAVSFLQIIADGFTYDPGHSDLDNKQIIHVRMTLGDYRKALNLLHEVKKTV